MELDIKASAKFIKVSRTTIYKKIEQGELSKTPSGRIDTAELLRVFGEPSIRDSEHKKTALKALNMDTEQSGHTSLLEKIKMLEDSLKESRESLGEARSREEWLKTQIERMGDTIKLLEAPQQDKKRGLFSRLFGD